MIIDFVNITCDAWTANHQHFLSVVVHGISDDFKNHLTLPSFATCKTGPAWKLCHCGKVFESVSAALPGKRIALQQQTMDQT